MDILIKSIKVINPGKDFHNKSVDILIEKGIIKKIASNIKSKKGLNTYNGKGQCVSIGWLDMKANFCDPGYEYKEDLLTGMKASAQGGFTGVAIMPSTKPALQSKSDIEYVINKTKGNLVDVMPVGSISKDLEGNQLTELYDMKQAGAVAFTNDKKYLSNSGFVLRALQYATNIKSLFISYSNDENLIPGAHVHEGTQSTLIGMKGQPDLSEKIGIERDLALSDYADANIHFSTISTKLAIDSIAKAKKERKGISSEVAAHHLLLSDEMLSDYDSNYKVQPPLRDEKTIKSLRKAVSNGSIDVICSDHTPQDIDSKELEFDFAKPGIVAAETAFACARTALPKATDINVIIKAIALNPRKVLSIALPKIKEGEKANLTLFDADEKWTFTKEHIQSKSNNTPFIGYAFKGKTKAVINNNKISYCK
ncbi:MAG: dihydroorotase [Bacteroidia bacterium]|nr:dihydroorotase [Bacteroidia bacterium]